MKSKVLVKTKFLIDGVLYILEKVTINKELKLSRFGD